jgi:hypothetical protein
MDILGVLLAINNSYMLRETLLLLLLACVWTQTNTAK